MYSETVTVVNPAGLHARPAALLATKANEFGCAVRIKNVSKGGDAKDAKSMIAVMTAQVSLGNEVEVSAEGDGERQAVEALVAFIASGCGE